MKRRVSFSKLDNILKPMLGMHKIINPKRLFLIVLNSIKEIIPSPKQQTSVFLRVSFKIFFTVIGFIIAIPIITILFAIYIVVATITSVVSTLIILSLSLVYGFLPFLIKYDKQQVMERKEKVIYKGYHKLRYPITWSIGFLPHSRSNVFRIGRIPLLKIKELNEDTSKTYILNRMALAVACIYSFTLYIGLTLITMQFLNYIVILVLGLTFGSIWLFISFIIRIAQIKETSLSDSQVDKSEKNLEDEK